MTSLSKTDRGRLKVDGHLRALSSEEGGGEHVPNIFAIGDVAGELPTLAAVAMRQGAYVAKVLNNQAKGKALPKPYEFQSLGSMVSFGPGKAIVDFPGKFFDMKGFTAFLGWRAAYFTMLGSFRSRLYGWLSTGSLLKSLAATWPTFPMSTMCATFQNISTRSSTQEEN